MMGIPKGSLPFEEDLAQMREDLNGIQNDVNLMR